MYGWTTDLSHSLFHFGKRPPSLDGRELTTWLTSSSSQEQIWMDTGLCVNVKCVVINCVHRLIRRGRWDFPDNYRGRHSGSLESFLWLVFPCKLQCAHPHRIMFHCTQLHARENYGVKYLSQASGQYLPASRAWAGRDGIVLDERVIGRSDGKSQKARGNPPKLSPKEFIDIPSRIGIVPSSRSTISHKARISPSLQKSHWASEWALGIHNSQVAFTAQS